jgi:hypothetical protein
VEMFDVGGSFEFGGHAVGVGLGLSRAFPFSNSRSLLTSGWTIEANFRFQLQ